jgi:hypothetical protein
MRKLGRYEPNSVRGFEVNVSLKCIFHRRYPEDQEMDIDMIDSIMGSPLQISTDWHAS